MSAPTEHIDAPAGGVVETGAAERVLIVEDDQAARVGLEQLVTSWGFTAESATDGVDALAKVTSFRPAIVISDLVMPRLDGIGLLRALREQGADVTTLLLTAQGTVETAVEAMKEGAYDYCTKPVDIQRLKVLLDKIVERLETMREVKTLRRQLRERGTFGPMIGNSPEMRKIYQVIEQASPTNASVLITGESGTGKELVAQTIHQLSPRASFPFVALNCAAIPETLLESEIFGHEKGAFTGAAERRQGCFELADRGTLFLDEVGEMTPATQVKLLRVLQERRFRRLGGRVEQAVDVRVIAATNVDPTEAVANGKLREDLYYRLNVFALRLPPLRERKEDLSLLVQSFITEFSARNQKAVSGADREAMDLIEQYDWPGNVRELRNAIERATILAPGQLIEARHLPPALFQETLPARQAQVALAPGTTVEEAERQLIVMTLEHTRDNKTRAAEILGISLKTLHNKLNKLRLRPGKDAAARGASRDE
ncbi:MAG: sigma-54-dependent transcriptional regulator [Vicinamibacterales bacterium]